MALWPVFNIADASIFVAICIIIIYQKRYFKKEEEQVEAKQEELEPQNQQLLSTFHILNGDALKEQFPTDKIPGEIIITRECLIEGPVNGSELDEFVEKRAKYFEETYQSSEYLDYTFSELKRIAEISDGEVYLWFEEDLFCQTNLWFVCSLLYLKEVNVHLVIPKDSLRYGFGGFDADGLEALFSKEQLLTKVQVNQFALLWFAYQKDNIERLLKLGVQMNTDFPFVMRAIEAHFDRIPKDRLCP